MKVRLPIAAPAATALVSTSFPVVQRDNFFVGPGTPIPRSHTLDPAASVKSIAMAGAGHQ